MRVSMKKRWLQRANAPPETGAETRQKGGVSEKTREKKE